MLYKHEGLYVLLTFIVCLHVLSILVFQRTNAGCFKCSTDKTTVLLLKGKGGVNASLMSFGGTGRHKYVVVRLIEITHNMYITPLE